MDRQYGHFVAPLSIHSLHFGHFFLLGFARRPVLGRWRDGLDLAGADEALDIASNGSGTGTGGLGTVVTLPQNGHVSRWPTSDSGELISAPHFGQACSIIIRPFSFTSSYEPYDRSYNSRASAPNDKDTYPPVFPHVVIRLPQCPRSRRRGSPKSADQAIQPLPAPPSGLRRRGRGVGRQRGHRGKPARRPIGPPAKGGPRDGKLSRPTAPLEVPNGRPGPFFRAVFSRAGARKTVGRAT